jgi:hypothetical protein
LNLASPLKVIPTNLALRVKLALSHHATPVKVACRSRGQLNRLNHNRSSRSKVKVTVAAESVVTFLADARPSALLLPVRGGHGAGSAGSVPDDQDLRW